VAPRTFADSKPLHPRHPNIPLRDPDPRRWVSAAGAKNVVCLTMPCWTLWLGLRFAKPVAIATSCIRFGLHWEFQRHYTLVKTCNYECVTYQTAVRVLEKPGFTALCRNFCIQMQVNHAFGCKGTGEGPSFSNCSLICSDTCCKQFRTWKVHD
jgi:hypothetical protein